MRNHLLSHSREKIKTRNVFPSLLFIGLILFSCFGNRANAQNCSVNAGNTPDSLCQCTIVFAWQLTPPVQNGAQVIWSQIAVTAATIVDPTNLNTQVTNLLAGHSYTFRISTTCGDGGLTYQDVTHTVKAITLATAGSNATYCPGAVHHCQGNTPRSMKPASGQAVVMG